VTLSVATYEPLIGQRVTAIVNLEKPNVNGELAIEVVGVLEAVHEHAIMIRPRGKVKREMIRSSSLEDLFEYRDKVPGGLSSQQAHAIKTALTQGFQSNDLAKIYKVSIRIIEEIASL
jgi:hypothetical protein